MSATVHPAIIWAKKGNHLGSRPIFGSHSVKCEIWSGNVKKGFEGNGQRRKRPCRTHRICMHLSVWSWAPDWMGKTLVQEGMVLHLLIIVWSPTENTDYYAGTRPKSKILTHRSKTACFIVISINEKSPERIRVKSMRKEQIMKRRNIESRIVKAKWVLASFPFFTLTSANDLSSDTLSRNLSHCRAIGEYWVCNLNGTDRMRRGRGGR